MPALLSIRDPGRQSLIKNATETKWPLIQYNTHARLYVIIPKKRHTYIVSLYKDLLLFLIHAE